DHLLAVEVTAAFRVHLVLDVQPGHPGVFQHLDGTGDVHRLPETGVGVHQGGQFGDTGYLRTAGGDLTQGGEPDVGQAEIRGDDRTGDVDAVETLLLDKPRRERVERARQQQDLLL